LSGLRAPAASTAQAPAEPGAGQAEVSPHPQPPWQGTGKPRVPDPSSGPWSRRRARSRGGGRSGR
jgi:hypothetical protein